MESRQKNQNRGEVPAVPPLTGEGYILFQVTTALGAIPLEGAEVKVTAAAQEDSVFAVMSSGADGKAPLLPLPAPDKALSLSARGKNAPLPYAVYDAEVSLAGYYTQHYRRIPVFDGVTAVQRVDLIPLPLGGGQDSAPGDTFVTEGQSPDL